mmetsp:Transcript_43048/g.93737  ORF Transcript_43048/g.93737 Transcript_43048/m.93737 type:complete len:350 (+) Transcript_43048:51-1100(+)|eukprot:CAMPEP_0170600484 /NCGR_PEP_ID=MMETSP0224-20130122/17359_1 /TAXON_ID=285029 /ORGANISM="Togula jolla, Strain CCCM 725" /LENGTH=349 /DNA_ID=CAMNT_0010925213 /DNA_START=43 /DNA_END=1092 /DNA_ORIENTATION=+
MIPLSLAVDEKGRFARTESAFRNFIQPGCATFPPEKGRYHLYVCNACPWACRCIVARNMKGLQDTIGLSVVHPTWQRTRPEDESDQHCGWVFRSPDDPPVSSAAGHGSFSCAGCIPDTVNGAKCVRDLYELANDTIRKYSVPVLWDKKHKTIVNNESSEILRILNSAFNADGMCANPELDLYPEDLRKEIDSVNEWIYRDINNGVYKCGFSNTQEAYDEAITALHAALERCEEILSKQRYLCGERFTEADIRLFMTLVRFDDVYAVYFKTYCRNIREYPNIMDYCRELLQMPGMEINFEHNKMHYYTSHASLNPYAIIPRCPMTEKLMLQPHSRDRFPGQPIPLLQKAH